MQISLTKQSVLPLLGLGLVLLLACAVVQFVLPQDSARLRDPRAVLVHRSAAWMALSLLPCPRHPAADTALAVGAGLAAVVAHAAAVRISWRRPAAPAQVAIVLGVALLAGMVSVAAPPQAGSADLFAHMRYARVLTVQGANPYLTPPDAFADDPLASFNEWGWTTTPYGPVWTLLSAAAYRAAGEDVVYGLLVLRGLLVGVHLAAAGLIWAILGRLSPRHRVAGLVFYAWSPVGLLHAHEHPDATMAFLLLLGLLAALGRRRGLAPTALALSALTKFLTLPLLGLYLLHLWRRRPRRAVVIAASLVGATALAVFAPVWDGPAVLLALAQDPESGRPLEAAGRGILGSPRRALFLIGLPAVLWWAAQRTGGGLRQMVRGWAGVMLWVAVGLVPNWGPWHLLVPLATASLVRTQATALLFLAVGGASVLTNLLGSFPPATPGPAALYWALWWAPLLLALCWVHRAALLARATAARASWRSAVGVDRPARSAPRESRSP